MSTSDGNDTGKLSVQKSKINYGVSYLPSEEIRNPYLWRKDLKLPKVLDAYGNKQWHNVQEKVKYLLTEEYEDPTGYYVKKKQHGKHVDTRYVMYEKDLDKERKPIKTYQSALDLCCGRYIKYSHIIKELNDVEQLMVHPQKRKLVRICLEGALIRMLEYKDEMIKLDLREFQFIDSMLSELGLTPEDISFEVPHHFITGRLAVLKQRQLMLEFILNKGVMPSTNDGKRKYVAWMPIEEAILIIQKNQRRFMHKNKFDTIRLRAIDLRYQARYENEDNESTVADIGMRGLRKWVSYVRTLKKDRDMTEEYMSLGMIHDTNKEQLNFRQDWDNHVARNTKIAEENDDLFMHEKVMQEESLKDNEAAAMAWRLRQNIIQWALELHDFTGKFPDLPEELDGGSALIFSKKSLRDVEDDLDELEEKMKKFKKDKKDEKKGKKEKQEKLANKKKPKKPVDQEFSWVMPESKGLSVIEEVEHSYAENWLWKNDGANLKQEHDQELLKEDLREGIEETIRIEVDELMRQELANLTMAVDKLRIKPAKKKKESGKKKKKQKADLTANRTIEELYEELVQDGIIIQNEAVSLSDFLGDNYYCANAVEDKGQEVLPSLALVRRQVLDLAVIPLCSSTIHERAPLIKSIMLAGTRCCGKKLLVNIICHEAGANLFNLTPSNLEGKSKYEGKKGMQLLFHTVMKVGKAMEPSVYFVENCEKMYLKKKDKTDTSKPHKWAPYFSKALKVIRPGDRLLFVGTTRMPYMAKQELAKTFQRIIIIPRPEYNSRMVIWQNGIYAKIGRKHSNDIDFSSLSKVTNGFTAGDIINVVKEVLTETRLSGMRKGRLTAAEFVARMATFDPIYRDEENMMYEWFINKTVIKKRVLRRFSDL